MTLIPTLKCKDLNESLEFYTKVLGFALEFSHSNDDHRPQFAGIIKEGCLIHLSSHEGDGAFGSVVYLVVEEVDGLFDEFVKRGLKPGKMGSPVHQGPTNQTWGMREFYVDDPSGNTLRFGSAIR